MKRSWMWILLALLCHPFLNAQPITKSNAEKMLTAAKMAEEQNDYYNALEQYEEYYKEKGDRDIKIAYKAAQLHLQLRDYARAERWYKRIVRRRNSKKFKNPYMPEARYNFARILKMNAKYDEAIEQLQLYISEAEDLNKITLAKVELTGAEMAREMDPVVGMEILNAGKNVNSKYSEYSPILRNESELFFTAIQAKKVIVLDGSEDNFYSKVFTARMGEEGWDKATSIEGTNLNRPGYHIGNLTFSPDGNSMYFTRARLEGNIMVESQLYISQRGSDGWGPANLVEGINGDYIVKQPAVGELFGKEVMFFASNMDGGYGGYDLYYSTRTGEGYTPPVNLGDVINTIGEEETPYYLDGKLYFSSTGHPGIGGFDVFNADWSGSGWSAPVNMGTPFNSSVDDLYFSIDKDGFSGALASNRPGTKSVKGKTCCNDIYTFQKSNVALDLLTTIFTEKKPLNGAKVQFFEIVDNKVENFDTRQKENGNKYTFLLGMDKSYKLLVSREGYFPDSLEFTTQGLRKTQTIEKSFDLKPVPKKEPELITITTEEPIRLNNIYYDFDDDKILADAEKDLTFLMGLMNDYPDLVIELSSHTDAQGTTPYNRRLSQRRADSAKKWLTDKGIPTERIEAVGYGESQILNRCVNGTRCSDEEHRFNRRTEFKILSGPKSIKIEKEVLKDAKLEGRGESKGDGQKKK